MGSQAVPCSAQAAPARWHRPHFVARPPARGPRRPHFVARPPARGPRQRVPGLPAPWGSRQRPQPCELATGAAAAPAARGPPVRGRRHQRRTNRRQSNGGVKPRPSPRAHARRHTPGLYVAAHATLGPGRAAGGQLTAPARRGGTNTFCGREGAARRAAQRGAARGGARVGPRPWAAPHADGAIPTIAFASLAPFYDAPWPDHPHRRQPAAPPVARLWSEGVKGILPSIPRRQDPHCRPPAAQGGKSRSEQRRRGPHWARGCGIGRLKNP
jgi:hypothetical protein